MGFRVACHAAVGLLLWGTCGQGVAALGSEASRAIGQAARGRAEGFSEAPRSRYLGLNPKREPRTRGGLWSEKALADAEASQSVFSRPELLIAGDGGLALDEAHTTSVEAAPGSTLPWEMAMPGNGPNGRGQVNSGNGNKLTALPLTGWKARGGMEVEFTLYHNSQTTYNDELGKGWTWTYDVYLNQAGSTVTIHWGDGLAIPFTLTGGLYVAATGIRDKLVKNADNTFTVTKPDGRKFNFNLAGFLVQIKDRNNNTITLTLNGANYVTQITDPTGRAITIALDGSNNFTSITAPDGKQWSFTRNGSDQLTTVTWPVLDGSTYTDGFTYTGASLIATHTDRRGKVWTYTYFGDGSLKTAKNPLNNTWNYAYTGSSATMTDPRSKVVTLNYSSGKIVSSVDRAGFSETYAWNASNFVSSVTDKRGKVWAYTYDSNGNVLTVTSPRSKVWTYTYNGSNDLLTEKDPLNQTNTYTYDSAGNQLTMVDALSRTLETYVYDSYGQATSFTDALSHAWTYAYDSNGNLTSYQYPTSESETYSYDSMSRVSWSKDTALNQTSYTYDSWGRLSGVTNPDASTESASYLPTGQTLTVTNARGKTTSYGYDDAGRMTSWTNPRADVETYAYDVANRCTSVVNGRGKTRTYGYTDRGEVSSLTLADGAVETWSYAGNGELTGYTNPLSQTILYPLDNDSRLTGVDYPAGTDTTFTYDDADRRTAMVDATGTTSWTYDAADQLTALSTPQGNISYGYDGAGRRNSMADATGTTTYTYDNADRMKTLVNPLSETTTWDYDSAGRVSKQTFANTTYTEYAYDVRNRPTMVRHRKSAGPNLTRDDYTYDANSNLLTRTTDSVVTTFAYDDNDQLTSESRSGYSASYTYDGNGNRLTKVLGGVTESYTYDDGDKLLSAGSKTYGYDSAGRTTSVTSGGTSTTLTYDYEGRVTGITYPGGATNSFTYNGLDTRVSKVDSGGTKTYRRDGAYVTDSVLSDGLATYTPGVSERRSGNSKFAHLDYLGSLKEETNSGQGTSTTRSYDAFGNVLSTTGTVRTPFGFAGGWGYQEDGDSGLKLLGHRYYDSSTGRFLSRDPVGDGRNWYVYCENRPVDCTDPSGLWDMSESLLRGSFNNWSNYPILIVWDEGKGPGRHRYYDYIPPHHRTTDAIDVDFVWDGHKWIHLRGGIPGRAINGPLLIPIVTVPLPKEIVPGKWPAPMGGKGPPSRAPRGKRPRYKRI